MSRSSSALDLNSQARLRSELVELWTAHNLATPNTTLVEAEYLEVIATRSPVRRSLNAAGENSAVVFFRRPYKGQPAGNRAVAPDV